MLGFDLSLLGLFYGPVPVLLFLALLLFAITYLLFLLKLLGFLLLLLPLDTGIALVGELDQFDDAGALLLHVLVSQLLILLLHIPALIAVLGLSWVILVEIGEVPPRIKVVPEFIEFEHLLDWSRGIAEVGNRLLLGEESITTENTLEQLVEGILFDVHDISLTRDGIVEGERRVIALALGWVNKGLIGILDLQPNLLIGLRDVLAKLVRMVHQG